MGKSKVKLKLNKSAMRKLGREWARSFNDGNEEVELLCPLCGAHIHLKADTTVCPECGGAVNVSAEL